jgi:energy-coupling factor transporter transmembrane protein EcfT
MLPSEVFPADLPNVKPGLNWKRGGIAFVLALLVFGLGQLYCRRWRLAISYQLLLLAVIVVFRRATLRSLSDGAAILGVALAFQLFVLGQALWFGL